jgi:glycerol-3-phosphate acyltransferase PlsY
MAARRTLYEGGRLACHEAEMNIVFAIVLAYFFGSVPFAFLLTRRRGIDLRLTGSGNVGAANVLRTSGVSPAVIVMVLDAFKGAAAVLMAQAMTQGAAVPVAAGLASMVGHIYPMWLGFRGGKGVATGAGVFAVLAPIGLLVASGVFLLTIWATRFISAGSLAAAIALAIATALGHAPRAVIVGAIAAALIIIHRHRANVARLTAGTERRVGLRLFERR